MKSIKVFALSSCELCKKLIAGLGYRGVEYNIIAADGECAECDRLENIIGLDRYPIVLVDGSNIHYIAPDSSHLGVKYFNDTYKLHGHLGVKEMLETIK